MHGKESKTRKVNQKFNIFQNIHKKLKKNCVSMIQRFTLVEYRILYQIEPKLHHGNMFNPSLFRI